MSNPLFTRIDKCRSCGGASLDLLDLGVQPPANGLRQSRAEDLPRFPLEICRCPSCATVQLTVTVDPAFLFEHYVWVTGTSSTANEYSRRFCAEVRRRAAEAEPLLVVEVASNDGTFLRPFQEAGARVLGVDPARNIAQAANAAGIETWAEFFNQRTAARIRAQLGAASVAFARNVLPHVPDPLAILKGMADCIREDGLVVVEFHQADAILDELHYDSIYHEHLFFYSLAAMESMVTRAGLYAFDLMRSPISGGSLVLFCSRQPRQPTGVLLDRRQAEIVGGTNTLEKWQAFAQRARRHKDHLKAIVDQSLAAGRRLIGWGASARSSTLLNFCAIDHRHLLAVADRSPYKHGTLTPGTDIRILPPDAALALKPDVVLLLAWNFRSEILAELAQRGFRGQVILPLPGDPSVLSV